MARTRSIGDIVENVSNVPIGFERIGESRKGSLRSGLVRVAGLVSIGTGLRSDIEGEIMSS